MKLICEYPESEYKNVCSIEHDTHKEVAYVRSYDRFTMISFYTPTPIGSKTGTLWAMYEAEINQR